MLHYVWNRATGTLNKLIEFLYRLLLLVTNPSTLLLAALSIALNLISWYLAQS
jgi:hypothetical protein